MKNLTGLFFAIFCLIFSFSTYAQIPPPGGGGSGSTIYYLDADGDGYGDSFTAGVTSPTTGYSVTNNADCDDTNAAINPDTRWYRDADGDGFGTSSTSLVQCFQPSGYVLNSQDCNDGNSAVNPNKVWYRDRDGDGYGDSSTTTQNCTQPSGYVANNTDCNDLSSTLTSTCSYSSGVTGSSPVEINKAYTYTASGPVSGGKWKLLDNSDGTINSQNNSTANITWSSTGAVTVLYGFDIQTVVEGGDGSISPGTLTFLEMGRMTINAYNLSVPGITVSNGCDESTLSYSASAPNGVSYYWQNGSIGTNTSASRANSSYTVTSDGTYHLRAKVDNHNLWGTASSKTVTVTQPTTWYRDRDNDGYGDASTTTSACSQPNGYVSNDSDCDDFTNDLTTQCSWSYGVTGDAVVIQGQTYTYTADQSVPNGEWKVGSGGTIVSSNANVVEVTWGGTGSITLQYGFDVQEIIENQNGSISQGDLTFLTVAATTITSYNLMAPAISVVNDCGESALSYTATPPGGVSYYWQTWSNGTNTSASRANSSFIVSADDTYYLRAKVTAHDVWGDARSKTVNVNEPSTWYLDDDGDGYGDSNTTQSACSKPTGYVSNSNDCDDEDADINPATVWYYDGDGDGYGKANTTKTQCTQPVNYVRDNTDCNDSDPNKNAYLDCNTDPINPTDDQILQKGVTYTFTWLDPSNGTLGYYLSVGGQSLEDGNKVYGNSYTWTPNANTAGIRFRAEAEDQSKAYESGLFDVVGPIIVNVDQSKYYPSEEITASWSGGASSETYTVELLKGGVVQQTKTSTGTSKKFTLSSTPQTGKNYKVRVTQNANSLINNTGGETSNFSVFKPLKVTYPNAADETFVFGESVNISWEGEDDTATYDVKVLDGSTVVLTWSGVSGTTLNPNWVVTKSETGVGSNYKIQVVQGSEQDKSNHVFNIGFPTAATMTPADGAILAVGQSVPLSWSGAVANTYKVFLNDTELAEITGTTHSWTVPNQIGEFKKLRVESTDGLYVSKSGAFEIASHINLSSVEPVVMHGETLFLSWTGGSPNLDYSVEMLHGSTTTEIYTGRNKSFDYLVPGTWAIEDGYRIKVSQNSHLHDTSGQFEITECNVFTEASTDQNYVKIYTARTVLGPCMAGSDDPFLVQEAVNYVDGLGRQLQTIVRNSTPADATGNTYDLVTHYDYDEFGRQHQSFLPYPGPDNTGALQSNALADQQAYYTGRFGANDGLHAYSEEVYESSPLNRVVKVGAPGDTWRADGAYTMDTEYLLNNGTENVRILLSEGLNIIDYGTYVSGELNIVRSSDENNGANEGITVTYTNLKGQVVLKRVRLQGNEYASTYYIYDDFSNIRHIIQPEGVKLIDDPSNSITWSNSVNDETFRSRWMFSYEYDNKQRLIAKRIPGSDWVRMVYDDRDRMVLTQNGNQNLEEFRTEDIILDGDEILDPVYEVFGAEVILEPGFQFTASASSSFTANANEGIENGGWTFTKYDELNRPVVTGRMERLADRSTLDDEAVSHYSGGVSQGESYTGSGPLFGYTNHTFPTEFKQGEELTEEDLLTVTYYDNYDFTGVPVPTGALPQIKGSVTGLRTRVLGTDTWLTTINYYDSRYRLVKTIADNYLGGQNIDTLIYLNPISSLVSRMETVHTGAETVSIVEEYTYDHMDRLLQTTHSINGAAPVIIASNTYNEIGETVEKNLGGDTTPVQSVDYAYNIRGWLTDINQGTTLDNNTDGDKFGMSLRYEDAVPGHEQYNGNIGQLLWRSKGGGLQNTAQHYAYTYDASKRLTSALYTGDDNFNVDLIAYDFNGNITRLQRNTRDDLIYDYGTNANKSNRLLSVTDNLTNAALFEDRNTSGDDYAYDDNGNVTKDLNKGISNIEYNYLNLPEVVSFASGKTITYAYDAGGTKLRKVVSEGESVTTTDYVRGIQFTNNTLAFLQHKEGRAIKEANSFEYEYNLTDHLGNVRVSVSESGSVVQRNGFYPFGLSFNTWADGDENDYLYNQGVGEKAFKTERQAEWGVDMTKLRAYDYAIGRFMQVDPLADQDPQENYSPYQYAYNNPVSYNDPYGDCPICPLLAKGASGAAVDYFLQGAFNYIGGMEIGEAFHPDNVDKTDVLVSGLTGMLPWSVPGGKYGKAAASAIGDVVINSLKAVANGEEYSLEQAGQDFLIGFIAELGSEQVAELFGDKVKKITKNTDCGCFLAGTTVLTKDGDKDIVDVEVGDLVYAYDESTEQIALKEVVHVFKKERDHIYRIYFGDQVIEATNDHPFFIGGKWLEVEKLSNGDELTLYSGKRVAIDSIIFEKGVFTVYNFEVADFHTYYVSGEQVLVHNSGCELVDGIPTKPNTVRRFVSKSEAKSLKRKGFKYDKDDSRGGLSSTSTSVKPSRPDKIKRDTGALGADKYVDIDVSNKNVKLKGKTKGGLPDWKIQDNVSPSDIVGSGSVSKGNQN